VGGSLGNLASLYPVQGRFAEAEPLYKRALVIDERRWGPSIPTWLALSNLAEPYRAGAYARRRFTWSSR
jgi:hypothetical protein